MKTYTLANASCQITVLDLGARLIDWQVSMSGKMRSIVLAYPNIEDYQHDSFYLGAVCGPYANRIAKGAIHCADGQFNLTCNDGENHLHGGLYGFDKQTWRLKARTDDSITLEYVHADGLDGYPGDICAEVDYRLAGNMLTMVMRCTADKPSVIGPTGHAYFNLNGTDSDLTGLDQYIQCDAAAVTPLGDDGIPSGDEVSVCKSASDFTQATLLQSDARLKKLDDNFVFNDQQNCSVLTDNKQHLALQVRSDYPAVQLYTGSFLDKPFKANQGVCIEPHYGANAPNRHTNYDWLVTPGMSWQKFIEYKLTVN